VAANTVGHQILAYVKTLKAATAAPSPAAREVK
jgi:hypothetical protein